MEERGGIQSSLNFSRAGRGKLAGAERGISTNAGKKRGEAVHRKGGGSGVVQKDLERRGPGLHGKNRRSALEKIAKNNKTSGPASLETLD